MRRGPDGTPALHWVVRVDDLDTARLLIQAGANVKFADRYGVTPIYLAASNGNAGMLKLLLDSGADANTVDPTGETTLMTAAKVGDLESVRVLLDRGAKVDAADPAFHQTALMIAVRENHPGVVQLLVQRGANVNAQTRTGETPGWDLAEFCPWFRPWYRHCSWRSARARLALFIPGGLTPLLYAARDGRLTRRRLLSMPVRTWKWSIPTGLRRCSWRSVTIRWPRRAS